MTTCWCADDAEELKSEITIEVGGDKFLGTETVKRFTHIFDFRKCPDGNTSADAEEIILAPRRATFGDEGDAHGKIARSEFGIAEDGAAVHRGSIVDMVVELKMAGMVADAEIGVAEGIDGSSAGVAEREKGKSEDVQSEFHSGFLL
jgi:hypothetical protein